MPETFLENPDLKVQYPKLLYERFAEFARKNKFDQETRGVFRDRIQKLYMDYIMSRQSVTDEELPGIVSGILAELSAEIENGEPLVDTSEFSGKWTDYDKTVN